MRRWLRWRSPEPVVEAPPQWRPMAGGVRPGLGQWCWVLSVWKDGTTHVFPACYEPEAAGCWTDHDAWEDYGGHVRYWAPIAPPPATLPAVIAQRSV